MKRIIGVYNAKNSILGEISYFSKKLLFNQHCSLCDITHTVFFKKKIWITLCKSFNYDIELLHLNELSKNLLNFVADSPPCVLIINEKNEPEIILSNTELLSTKKDPYLFFKLLNKKLKLV